MGRSNRETNNHDDDPITIRDIKNGAAIISWIVAIIATTLGACAAALTILKGLRDLIQ